MLNRPRNLTPGWQLESLLRNAEPRMGAEEATAWIASELGVQPLYWRNLRGGLQTPSGKLGMRIMEIFGDECEELGLTLEHWLKGEAVE